MGDSGRETIGLRGMFYSLVCLYFLQLKDKDKLNETTYHRIRPNDASTTKYYGLPKIHKENIPLNA